MAVIPRWRFVAVLVVAVALVGGACGKSAKKTVAGTKLTSLAAKP